VSVAGVGVTCPLKPNLKPNLRPNLKPNLKPNLRPNLKPNFKAARRLAAPHLRDEGGEG